MKSTARGGKKWMTAMDICEVRIIGVGFLLSLVWETLQSPFYLDTFNASWSTLAYNRVHCSIGDVMILLAAYWITASVFGRRWIDQGQRRGALMFMLLGFAYTLFSEHLNVYVRQSWAYSEWMPTLAGFGLVPLVQWIAVPALVVRLARCGEAHSRDLVYNSKIPSVKEASENGEGSYLRHERR